MERDRCDWVEAYARAAAELHGPRAPRRRPVQRRRTHPGRVTLSEQVGHAMPGRSTRSLAGMAGAALPAQVMRSAERAEIDPDAAERLARARRGGVPLDDALRSQLEAALRTRLDGVRIHTGGDANAAARSLGARAFALGDDVVFRDGAYDPSRPDGQRLIAHEVAHTVQARGAAAASGAATEVSQPDDAPEREADAFADGFVRNLHGVGGPAAAAVDPVVSAPRAGVVSRVQDPAAQRASRISVGTSVQAYRTTYPDARGGLLTQALLAQLRDRRTSVADAVGRVGDGARGFGTAPTSAEERAGTSLGTSAPAAAASPAQRRAVVVGNGVYNPGTHMGSTVEPTRPLPGSPRDSAAIGSALRGRGYAVTPLINQTAAQIDGALRTALAGLGAGSELVFYFSGHGTPEGLIGSDGVAFTPAQALALRAQARQAQVDLAFATDACHAGIFADAIRGAELADTRAAAQRRTGGGTGPGAGAPAAAPGAALVAVLDAAIAVQSAKDGYNTTTRTWWARRYELEVPINAGNATDAVMAAWQTHYNLGATNWNAFIAIANPALATLRTASASAGHALRPLVLTRLAASYDNPAELVVQAGLDDIDTLTNEVLTFANSQLPR